jgi:DNA transformation protein and related proteins
MSSAPSPKVRRNDLVEHCLELLSPTGAPSAHPMFGGHGLRIDGIFVALVAFDRLYLKADAQSRPRFIAAGCEPFVYSGKGKPMTLSYWTVPPEAMDSPESMQPWARLALDAALRAAQAKGKARAPRQAAGSKAVRRR